ncbi:MAG: phosphate acyltransferase PlsX [Firmicutes bacterium]|nr:phosphate acyltransferase PlsX [Bacillota bacterium]
MGGDHAPGVVVEGALAAARTLGLEILLVGREEAIERELRARGGRPPGVRIVPAAEVIGYDEPPVQAVRRKKDASLVVAARLVKEGQADGMLSAGSTGALLAAGLFIVGRMDGVDRPALGTPVPTRSGRPVLLLDVGANAENRPEHLVQFAVMGSVYAQTALGMAEPRVGLLNIGTEAEKGNALVKEAYARLKEVPGIRFIGFVEPRDVPFGAAEVVVTDGFTGNVVLKTYEGAAMALMGMLRDAFASSPLARVGGLLARPALRRVRRTTDWTEYGGAPLLGLRAPVVKCHGASDGRAILSGLRVLKGLLEGQAIPRMAAALVASLAGVGEKGKGATSRPDSEPREGKE